MIVEFIPLVLALCPSCSSPQRGTKFTKTEKILGGWKKRGKLEADYVAQRSWTRGVQGESRLRLINQEEFERTEESVNIVWAEKQKEKEAVSSKERDGGIEKMTDVAGGKERSAWERQPLRDCSLNPVPRLNPPPPSPCALPWLPDRAPMQSVNVFFSGRNELGTNVCQSVSCTINVNCPGTRKHGGGREPGNTEPPWPSLKEHHVTLIQSPENCSLCGFVNKICRRVMCFL